MVNHRKVADALVIVRAGLAAGIGYRCVAYHPTRCEQPATGFLVSPDGLAIQGTCQEYGEAVVNEYREKLGEEWAFAEWAQQ